MFFCFGCCFTNIHFSYITYIMQYVACNNWSNLSAAETKVMNWLYCWILDYLKVTSSCSMIIVKYLLFRCSFLFSQKRVSSERCAELTIIAATHGLKEVWISYQVFLLGLCLQKGEHISPYFHWLILQHLYTWTYITTEESMYLSYILHIILYKWLL